MNQILAHSHAKAGGRGGTRKGRDLRDGQWPGAKLGECGVVLEEKRILRGEEFLVILCFGVTLMPHFFASSSMNFILFLIYEF